MKNSIDLTKKIKEKAFEEGFDAVGIAKVPGSSRIKLRTASLERWLQAGHQAKMEWMKSPRRKNVEHMLEGVQSVLAVGLNYYVGSEKIPKDMKIIGIKFKTFILSYLLVLILTDNGFIDRLFLMLRFQPLSFFRAIFH